MLHRIIFLSFFSFSFHLEQGICVEAHSSATEYKNKIEKER